ncbi:MAG: hypothetical protein ABS948_04245 [Solibacillus sp.]
MKYTVSKELSRRTKGANVIYTDEFSLLEQATSEQEEFAGEWFEKLGAEEQQLLHWIFFKVTQIMISQSTCKFVRKQ